jgi:hypothetical protein
MYALPCTSEVVPVVSDSLYTWWSIVIFIIRLITSINALHALDTVGHMPHEAFSDCRLSTEASGPVAGLKIIRLIKLQHQ